MKIMNALFPLASLLFSLLLQGSASEAAQDEPLTQLEELEVNLAFWNLHEIVDYTYAWSTNDMFSSYLILVEDEKVVKVTDQYDYPVPDSFEAMTIPELLASMANRMREGEVFDVITYNEEYGFPKYLGNTVDNEVVEFLTPYTIHYQDLANARSLWEMSDVTGYNFTFLLPYIEDSRDEYTRPHIIQVQDGTITNVIDEQTGLDSSVKFAADHAQIVDAFFDDIQQALDARQPRINFAYDSVYGYPDWIYIDFVVGIADEEHVASLYNFVPVTPIWTEIFANDFEGGFGNFNDPGRKAKLYRGRRYSHSGRHSLQLRGDTRTSLSYTNPFSVESYSTLEVEFWYKARRSRRSRRFNHDSDGFVLQSADGNGDDGTEWVTKGSWTYESNVFAPSSNGWRSASVKFQIETGTTMRIRFKNKGRNRNDRIYIDDVIVSGN
jgi:hypothetical protein